MRAMGEEIAVIARKGLATAEQVALLDVSALHVKRKQASRLFEQALGIGSEGMKAAVRVAKSF